VTAVAPLNRTLEQELFALLRGASLECLVCGEFVLHRRGEICCPECGMTVARAESGSASGLQFGSQAG
jgi:Zn finger protein HypA/HybF involved in hydrogenase expression